MFLLSRGGVHWQGGPCFFFREGGSIGMGGPLAWGGGWYHKYLRRLLQNAQHKCAQNSSVVSVVGKRTPQKTTTFRGDDSVIKQPHA